MKFSVIIPTYKREKDLRTCLNAIKGQGVLPSEIIALDDDVTRKEFIDEFKSKFNSLNVEFIYYKKDHSKKEETQGSSTSRDLGIKMSKNEAVFIFDDDIILGEDYFKYSIETWQKFDEDKMIGVAGLISNERKKSRFEKLYNKIFGLTSKIGWDVNDVGFQTWDQSIKAPEKGYYMHGGLCSYKKNPTMEFKFSVFSGGRTGLIDPDFSLRAKKAGYFFIIDPRAKAIHNHSSDGRESSYLSGWKEGRNRKIIFYQNCEKNIKNYIWFVWSSFGWALRQAIIGKFKKSFGMLMGYFSK